VALLRLDSHSFCNRRMDMRRLTIALLLVTAALASPPLGVAASANPEHALRIRLLQPVSFPQTADCPNFAIMYGISVHRKIGTGTNCILEQVAVDCPPDVTAQFCQNVPVTMTLSLRGSTLKADVTIFEAWTCTASCAVDQRWSGTVTSAERRFRGLTGGSVAGGALVSLDAATFEVLAFDGVLIINPAGTNDEEE
jgi:hypothetical protein